MEIQCSQLSTGIFTTWLPFQLMRPLIVTCVSSVFTAFVTVNIYALFASKLFSPVCTGLIIAPLYLFKSENRGARPHTARSFLLLFGTVKMSM